MNRPSASRGKGTNLFVLLEALRDTERQIAELRADVPDTALGGQHQAILFRRAKRQRRQADIAAQAATLEALPAHVAVLDAAGFIIAVNEAWRLYDRADTTCGPGHAIGVNYLDVCDQTTGGSLIAKRVATGIRAVLKGTQANVALEYACPLPTMERWLALTVVPLDAARPNGAIVMHVDVTAAHLVQESLLASDRRFRQMSETIDEVFFLRDPSGSTMFYVSPAYEQIWGRSCASLYADPASMIAATHPDDRAAADATIEIGNATGRFAAEFRVRRPDGSIRWVRSKGFPVHDDTGAVVRIAGIAEDITERKEALANLHESEARYRTLIETSFDAVAVSQDGIILEVNAGFERTFGYAASEVVGCPTTDYVAPESRDRVREHESSDADATCELVGIRKDGRRILLDATTRVHSVGGRPARITALRDMTERRQLEVQVRQAQKMEAVGRLAAGIAHDFNNQLSVIMACASFMHDDLPHDDPHREDVDAIQAAATGAAALTRQLLVFGRQQAIPRQIVALNASVHDAEKMLRRLIGEDVDLVIIHGRAAATTLIDPGYVDQLILNLVVNARDAMPTGGTVTIETRVVDLDDSFARPDWPIVAGRFALLAVTDTGIGMAPETAAQVFEPFFTTKAAGVGTGLGLATVYGIVRQSGGSVSVYTELGHGTCFKIYLPFVSGDGLPQHLELPSVETVSGTESVLLAEDSAPVRRAIRQMLERFGYRVVEAATSVLALELARESDDIDLLLTDVIMPEISGRILAERIGALRPDMKVLFMSGYTDDAVLRHGILSSAVDYIEKPFRPHDLARKVRDVLDSPARTGLASFASVKREP